MYGNVNGCASIYNWEAAEKHFERTPRPRERKARPVWSDNERPLDDARKHHYRLVRDEDDGSFYDVCLYSTIMARYYKPDGDTRVVAYNFDARPTSSQFMWSVTGSSRRMLVETTDRRKLYVPICKQEYSGFGTTLTLVNNKLDVSRSRHRTIGTEVMSDEKKAWLKQARVFMQPFFDLMSVRVSTLRENTNVNKWRGRLGYGASFHANRFRDAGIDNVPFAFEEADVEALAAMYAAKVQSILQGAAWRNEKEDITNEQIAKRAATNLIADMSDLYPGKDTKFRPLPQFPENLPVRFVEE